MDRQMFANAETPFLYLKDETTYKRMGIAYTVFSVICLIAAVLVKNWGLLVSAVVCAAAAFDTFRKSKMSGLLVNDLRECNLTLSDNFFSVQQATEFGRYETVNIRLSEVVAVIEDNTRKGVPMFYVKVQAADDEEQMESQLFIDGVIQPKWTGDAQIDGRNYNPEDFQQIYLTFLSQLNPDCKVTRTETQQNWFKKTSKVGMLLPLIIAVLFPVLYFVIREFI